MGCSYLSLEVCLLLQGRREAGAFTAAPLGAAFSTQRNMHIAGGHELPPWGHALNGQPSPERECSAHFHTSLLPSGRQLRPPCQTPSEGQADGVSGAGWAMSVQSKEGQGCSLVLLRVWAWEQSTRVLSWVCCHSGPHKVWLCSCVRRKAGRRRPSPHVLGFPS